VSLTAQRSNAVLDGLAEKGRDAKLVLWRDTLTLVGDEQREKLVDEVRVMARVVVASAALTWRAPERTLMIAA
jgi:hypothetical protein